MRKIADRSADDFHSMYRVGFYVNIDRQTGEFYWDREDDRHVILLNEAVAKKADRIIRKEVDLDFTCHFASNPARVLDSIQDKTVKPKSWLNGSVREIYEVLLANDLAFCLEARFDGALAGGLIAVPIGHVVTVDTMFGLPSPQDWRSASKTLFCRLAQQLTLIGVGMIDVENKHHANHPCARLGETCISIKELRAALSKPCKLRPKEIIEHFRVTLCEGF